MRWRFRRSLSIFPGFRINFGKKGVSASLGPRGAKVTVGTKGVRTSVGIPGSGVSVTDYGPWSRRGSSTHTPLKHANESNEMKSHSESTWWKRLFTVLEIAVALIGTSFFALVYFSESSNRPPLYGFLIALVPAGVVRLVRIAVTYVVEGVESKYPK